MYVYKFLSNLNKLIKVKNLIFIKFTASLLCMTKHRHFGFMRSQYHFYGIFNFFLSRKCNNIFSCLFIDGPNMQIKKAELSKVAVVMGS